MYFDPRDYTLQAGCIPIKGKYGTEKFKVLLVTSSYGGDWVFPKGSVKKGESLKKAAKRETREEAGIKGKALAPLEIVHDHERKNSVQYFPLVKKKKDKKKDWEESDVRKRKWFTMQEAFMVITRPCLRDALMRLQRYLETDGAGVDE
eukprot:TRINITY_DN9_c0_g1_i3.p1 TRINITY_DN9_c0_g1~~TRINITY_DN9_c0_g1_i3.p1  ORF type:complete len:148 (-),score=24.14 TRINITY_DN9_c0_g1_i3:138-581(-)